MYQRRLLKIHPVKFGLAHLRLMNNDQLADLWEAELTNFKSKGGLTHNMRLFKFIYIVEGCFA